MIFARSIFLWLVAISVTFEAANAEPAADELFTVDVPTIQKLVSQLASKSAAERENAERRLSAIGAAATGELQKAAGGDDKALAEQASKLLAALPTPNHVLLDASGKPIPRAALEFFRLEDDDTLLPKLSYAKVTTNDGGGFAFPALPVPTNIAARVVQPDYGIALIRMGSHDVGRAAETTLETRAPLVARDSEYGKRAVSGKVVDDKGQPVFGAEIRCSSVRTPGEGLINPLYPLHPVLTAKDGSFRLYLPNEEPGAADRFGRVRREQPERGKLIPENSRYNLEIHVPGDAALFPVELYVSNSKPATIRLKRATLKHRFDFEALEGGVIQDAERLKWITLTYHEPAEDGERRSIRLDRSIIRDGGLLLAGQYAASYRDTRGAVIEWQPLTVDDKSPDILRFKIPPPVVFSGRVVDGVTDKPVAGAFVVGTNGFRHNNLALVTPDEWTALEKLPAKASVQDRALEPLRQLYVLTAIVRTDEDGRFELIQAPPRKFHSLLTFARDRLPFSVSVSAFSDQLQNKPQVDVGDVPLFPAARLRVEPALDASEGRNVSVSPKYRLLQDGQPEWFARFQAATNPAEQRDFSTLHWLKLNEPQPLLVPAGLRFRMHFSCPYHDEWVPMNRQQVYQLATGAEPDFGKLTFRSALQVKVLVVGPDGGPIEGAPVRRMIRDGGERAWSVAHNTNAEGVALFHVPPGAKGQFGVLLHSPNAEKQIDVQVDFATAETPPDEPWRIELTEPQVQVLRGLKQ